MASFSRQIFNLLKKINRSPYFHTYQNSPAFFPQLSIDGLGELALPLSEVQAQQLIALCNKAPYGKGTKTIVDDSVRNVWELDARHMGEGNAAWQKFLADALRACEKQLDLQGQRLIAHPYKLLIYEEGSFFLAHQDSEKEDGMVATLIVALPSKHKGGELVISHHDTSVTIDFSDEARAYDFQTALFYADCQHEVLTVQKGYRLILTYNVCFEGQRELSAFDFSAQEKELATLFHQWKRNIKANDDKQLIIRLDHQYSADGFSLNALKGVDRSRADVLLHAADQADCHAYICLIEQYQMYSAWDEHEPDELIDDYLSICQLIDSSGNDMTMTLSSIDENSILTQYECDEQKAIEEEYEGYMGNYGNTLSRWYRHAAVILWPKEYQLDILARNSTSAAITYLNDLQTTEDPSFSEKLQCFVDMIDNQSCSTDDETFTLLTLILGQKSTAMATVYCLHILFTQNKLPTATKIEKLMVLCGWKYLKEHLDIEKPENRVRLFKILNAIRKHLHWNQQPELTALFYDSLEKINKDIGWHANPVEDFKLIFPLCLDVSTKESDALLTQFLNNKAARLNAKNHVLPYLEVIFPRITPSTSRAFILMAHWVKQQFSAYYQCAKQDVKSPATETIPNIDNCDCDDCQEIIRFMGSEEENIEIRRLKAGCEHIQTQIILCQVQVMHSISKNYRPWRFHIRKVGADQRDKIKAKKRAEVAIARLEYLLKRSKAMLNPD